MLVSAAFFEELGRVGRDVDVAEVLICGDHFAGWHEACGGGTD
jgi:hypothetical protein